MSQYLRFGWDVDSGKWHKVGFNNICVTSMNLFGNKLVLFYQYT